MNWATSWAYSLLGVTLHHHGDEIPQEQFKWLQGLVRDRLTRPEYKLLAEAYAWNKKTGSKG